MTINGNFWKTVTFYLTKTVTLWNGHFIFFGQEKTETLYRTKKIYLKTKKERIAPPCDLMFVSKSAPQIKYLL